MINFFSKNKFIFYLFNIVLIILYLFPGSLLGCYLYDNCQSQPQITQDFLISSNHLYAFFCYQSQAFLLIKIQIDYI